MQSAECRGERNFSWEETGVWAVWTVWEDREKKNKMGQSKSGKKHFKTHEDLAIYQLAFNTA